MENFKKIIILMLILAIPMNAYTLSFFNASSEINQGQNGGFVMNVTTSSSENLTGLTATAFILDSENNPMKQLCAYEDEDTCYLWTTDESGKVNGLFNVDNRFRVGQFYTLEVSIAGITQTKSFEVLPKKDLSDTMDWAILVANNWVWIILGLFTLFFVLLVIVLFFNLLFVR